MVLLEFSIIPLGQAESVSSHVARCVDIVDRSGLEYGVHAMGTVVEGELDQLLDLLRDCFEELRTDCDRITCTAKFDDRVGSSGRLASKVHSVEEKLGRECKRA
jgi:uncharacterized protein (TIGR00106 family)